MTSQIDRLFGSRTRVAVLSKLMINSERSFYIRELSKELRIPYSMLYKEVKNLESLGILNVEKKGKVTLLSVNRKLPYFAELKGMIIKTAGITDLIRNSLRDFKDLRYAMMYGSFATGEASSSDIDLLMVGDVEEERLLRVTAKIEDQAGKEINYILWSDHEFRKRIKIRHYLLADIARKPFIMIIGEESEFRRAVKKQGYQEDRT